MHASLLDYRIKLNALIIINHYLSLLAVVKMAESQSLESMVIDWGKHKGKTFKEAGDVLWFRYWCLSHLKASKMTDCKKKFLVYLEITNSKVNNIIDLIFPTDEKEKASFLL